MVSVCSVTAIAFGFVKYLGAADLMNLGIKTTVSQDLFISKDDTAIYSGQGLRSWIRVVKGAAK